jgi:hypothetical protein
VSYYDEVWNQKRVDDYESRLLKFLLKLPKGVQHEAEHEMDALFFHDFKDAKCDRILTRWGVPGASIAPMPRPRRDLTEHNGEDPCYCMTCRGSDF